MSKLGRWVGKMAIHGAAWAAGQAVSTNPKNYIIL